MALERLGLIVRSAPWLERGGRDALDLALATVTLDIALDLFFIGAGVHHLLDDRAPGPAGLPPGYRAWASLADLAPTRYFVAASDRAPLEGAGVSWLLDACPVEAAEMPSLQARCDRLLVV